jgi:hypothetical protein
MATLIDCPSCGRNLRVPDEFLDKSVRCPSCGATFRAPGPAAAPAPAPAAEAAPAPPPADPSPILSVPLNLELGNAPAAPKPAEPPPPRTGPAERRREPERDDDDERDDRRPRSRRRRDFEPCPRCGDDIRRGAVVCPYCGLDLEEQGDGYTRRGRVRMDAEPHRAGTVQALGIASLVLGAFYVFPLGIPLGIAAWVMGRNDLKKMEAGVMDPNGRKKTKDGWLCGLVGTLLNICWALGLAGFITLVVLAEQSSSNGRPPPAPLPPAPVRPAGKQGWPPPPPKQQPPNGFRLTGPGDSFTLRRGETKTVVVTVDRAPGFADRIVVRPDRPLPRGLAVDQDEMVVEAQEQNAIFDVSAENNAVIGENVLRLTGRGGGRQNTLELRVRVVR